MKRLLMLVAIVALGGCGWSTVHPGDRAVFATWGKVDPTCYKEGLYWYNPFTTDVYKVDVKVQKYAVQKLTAASQDLQEIHADVIVNFSVDGEKCHELIRSVGQDFQERVIVPAVSEVLKAGTAHFPIDKIIRERVKLKGEIVDGLRARLAPYYINVQDVALTDFGFAASFSRAVEAKQVEEQNVQRQEYVRQQAVKDAEARVARAEGEAKANRLLAESLKQSPETLRFRELDVMERKWNGVLPTVLMDGKTSPLLSIPRPKE